MIGQNSKEIGNESGQQEVYQEVLFRDQAGCNKINSNQSAVMSFREIRKFLQCLGVGNREYRPAEMGTVKGHPCLHSSVSKLLNSIQCLQPQHRRHAIRSSLRLHPPYHLKSRPMRYLWEQPEALRH